MKKTILKIVIISLCISALLAIFVILTGTLNEISEKILATTSLIFGFSISGLCCSTLYER